MENKPILLRPPYRVNAVVAAASTPTESNITISWTPAPDVDSNKVISQEEQQLNMPPLPPYTFKAVVWSPDIVISDNATSAGTYELAVESSEFQVTVNGTATTLLVQIVMANEVGFNLNRSPIFRVSIQNSQSGVVSVIENEPIADLDSFPLMLCLLSNSTQRISYREPSVVWLKDANLWSLAQTNIFRLSGNQTSSSSTLVDFATIPGTYRLNYTIDYTHPGSSSPVSFVYSRFVFVEDEADSSLSYDDFASVEVGQSMIDTSKVYFDVTNGYVPVSTDSISVLQSQGTYDKVTITSHDVNGDITLHDVAIVQTITVNPSLLVIGGMVGDPYITTLLDDYTFKLVPDNCCYRLFDSGPTTTGRDRLVVNGQMWMPSHTQSDKMRIEMRNYFITKPDEAELAHRAFYQRGMSFLRYVGIFFNDVSLFVDLESLSIVEPNKSRYPFRKNKCLFKSRLERHQTQQPLRCISMYDEDDCDYSLIQFQTTHLGLVTIKLAKYRNPQIRTGIQFEVQNRKRLHSCLGLCVREAPIKYLRLRKLLDVRYIHTKIPAAFQRKTRRTVELFQKPSGTVKRVF